MNANRSLSCWQVPEDSFTLECSDEVVEQLRSRASTEHDAGVMRGVLLGERNGNVVRPNAIVWDSTSEDRAPGGNGPAQRAVGWFEIRAHGDCDLTAENRQYFDADFPEAGAVALILTRVVTGSVRARVSFRQSDGALYEGEDGAIELPGRPARVPASEKKTTRETQMQDEVPRPPSTYTLFLAPPLSQRQTAKGKTVRSAGVALMSLALVVGGITLYFRESRGTGDAGTAAAGAAETCVFSSEVSTLKEQTRRLQAELENERVHNRRLEATLVLLRDRGGSSATSSSKRD
jgi:hypothetical protein